MQYVKIGCLLDVEMNIIQKQSCGSAATNRTEEKGTACRNRQDEEGKKGLGGGFLDDFETVGGDFHVGAAEVVDADANVGGVVATKADNMALKAGLLPA